MGSYFEFLCSTLVCCSVVGFDKTKVKSDWWPSPDSFEGLGCSRSALSRNDPVSMGAVSKFLTIGVATADLDYSFYRSF